MTLEESGPGSRTRGAWEEEQEITPIIDGRRKKLENLEGRFGTGVGVH